MSRADVGAAARSDSRGTGPDAVAGIGDTTGVRGTLGSRSHDRRLAPGNGRV